MMDRCDDNIRSWNEYEERYKNDSVCSGDFHYAMCLAGDSTYQMLPNLTGISVCDVGSGMGENAAFLASKAKSVIGLEPVEDFVLRARDQYGDIGNLKFVNADFASLNISTGCHFGLVTFIGSLDYIFLDDDFFVWLNKITAKGAYVIISKMHPLWTTLFDHELDPPTLEKSYFENRVDIVKYGNQKFNRFHYSLDGLVGLFQLYGWQVDKIKEPCPVPKGNAAFYMGQCYEDTVLMKRMSKLPMTLLIRFRRCTR